MREIKFRAWDTRKLIMSYGRKPYMYLTTTERLIGIGCDLHHSMYHDTSRSFEREIVLMQFTGLHDKSGKEIWEGDIVRWETEQSTIEILEVAWNKVHARFELRSPKSKYVGWHFHIGLADILEVIGNIYENPALRESK